MTSISTFLNLATLRELIDDVRYQASQKLAEWVAQDRNDESGLLVASLLLSQLTIQVALHNVPRERQVIDDKIVKAIIIRLQKLVAESVEAAETSADAAVTVSRALLACYCADKAEIWTLRYLARSAGAETEQSALEVLSRLVIWVTAYAPQLAQRILSDPTRPSMGNRNHDPAREQQEGANPEGVKENKRRRARRASPAADDSDQLGMN